REGLAEIGSDAPERERRIRQLVSDEVDEALVDVDDDKLVDPDAEGSREAKQRDRDQVVVRRAGRFVARRSRPPRASRGRGAASSSACSGTGRARRAEAEQPRRW